LILPKTLEPVVENEYVESLEDLHSILRELPPQWHGVIRITGKIEGTLHDVFVVVKGGSVICLEIENVQTGERLQNEDALPKVESLLESLENGEISVVVDALEGDEEDIDMLVEYNDVSVIDEPLPLTEVFGVEIPEEIKEIEEVEEIEIPEVKEEVEVETVEEEIRVEDVADEKFEMIGSRDFTKERVEEIKEELESMEASDREELLKKYGIEEPDESFVEAILEEFMGIESDIRERISRVLKGYGITVFKLEGNVRMILEDDADEEEIKETVYDFMKEMGMDEVSIEVARMSSITGTATNGGEPEDRTGG